MRLLRLNSCDTLANLLRSCGVALTVPAEISSVTMKDSNPFKMVATLQLGFHVAANEVVSRQLKKEEEETYGENLRCWGRFVCLVQIYRWVWPYGLRGVCRDSLRERWRFHGSILLHKAFLVGLVVCSAYFDSLVKPTNEWMNKKEVPFENVIFPRLCS